MKQVGQLKVLEGNAMMKITELLVITKYVYTCV